MKTNLTKCAIFIALLLTILAIPIIGIGCEEEQKVTPPAQPLPFQLSSTLVPNMELDLYAYIKQENPTILPKDILDTPSDIAVESLAFWGIPQVPRYVYGGVFTFDSAADAANTYAAIQGQSEIWTTLSNQTIYFVQGSGVVADTLKTAISKNDFKYYDDQQALQEVAMLPDGEKNRLIAVGIAKPNKILGQLIEEGIDSEASSMINTLMTWARLELITVGLYAPQQIDITQIAPRAERGATWETDFGILISVKSGLPGFLVSPIAKTFLENAGYTKTNPGELTIYKGYFDVGNDNEVPIMFNIEGNHLFVALSGNEIYAETLLTGVSRY